MVLTHKRVRIPLANSFHARKTTVLAHRDSDGRCAITVAQLRAAKRRLCGLPSCRCGGIYGAQPEAGLVLHVVDGPYVVGVVTL